MSDSEFRDVFDLLVRTTDEYSHLLPLLENSVLPGLAKTNALLDIGAGPGLISTPLSQQFNHIGIVEPDPVYCLEAVQRILAAGKLATAYNGMWDAAQLGAAQFDLIICAHVLYFVAIEEWESFIQKMIPLTAPGGRLAIILVAKGDPYTQLIQRELGIEEPGSYPFSAAVMEHVTALGHSYERLSFEATITTETPKELLEVLKLFPIMQYDKSSTSEQRLAMIEAHFKGDGQYHLPYIVDVVVVEPKS